MNSSTYGNGNNFNNNFGGMGACPGSMARGYGGGGRMAVEAMAIRCLADMRRKYLRVAAGRRSRTFDRRTRPPPAAPAAGQTPDSKPAVRVVANPLDNALIIQATPEQYQGILQHPEGSGCSAAPDFARSEDLFGESQRDRSPAVSRRNSSV